MGKECVLDGDVAALHCIWEVPNKSTQGLGPLGLRDFSEDFSEDFSGDFRDFNGISRYFWGVDVGFYGI